MAYKEISNPAAVMNYEITATREFFSAIGRFFVNIGSSLSRANSAKQRFGDIQALQAKSDADLAKLKIKREDIVNHVFRDLYYS